MFATLFGPCGYDLNVGEYKFIHARGVKYHVYRDKQWAIERFMPGIGMTSLDEGVSFKK